MDPDLPRQRDRELKDMASLAIYVTGLTAVDPYTQLHIDAYTVIEGDTQQRSFDIYVDFDASADEVNAALRTAAVGVATGLSISVGATDVKRVFAGALETPT
jgi:hypothetical protein